MGGNGSAAGAAGAGCCSSIFSTCGLFGSLEKPKLGTTTATSACNNMEAVIAQIVPFPSSRWLLIESSKVRCQNKLL